MINNEVLEKQKDPKVSEENLRVKIEKSATSIKVFVYQNQPAPPYHNGRGSIQTNKKLKDMRKSWAKLYFSEKEKQAKEEVRRTELWKIHLKGNPILLKRLLQVERENLTNHSNTPSFISAIQRAILNGSKISKYKNSNYEKRKKARENVVRDMIKNNFNETNTIFFTLTFDTRKYQAKDLEKCKKLFRNFILRLAKKYDNLKYIATFARQKNASWHFHMVVNICEISEKELKAIWKYGIVHTNQVSTWQHLKNICAYLITNMNQNQDELMSNNGYLCSKNLNRTQVLSSSRKNQEEECFEAFDQLKEKDNFLAYSKEKPVGKMVELSYPEDKTRDIFFSNEELKQDFGQLTIKDTIYMQTDIVIVANESKQQFFTRAIKK